MHFPPDSPAGRLSGLPVPRESGARAQWRNCALCGSEKPVFRSRATADHNTLELERAGYNHE